MIRNAAEYVRAKRSLEEDEAYLEALKADLRKAKLSPEEYERVIQPALSIHRLLRQAVEAYEQGQGEGARTSSAASARALTGAGVIDD